MRTQMKLAALAFLTAALVTTGQVLAKEMTGTGTSSAPTRVNFGTTTKVPPSLPSIPSAVQMATPRAMMTEEQQLAAQEKELSKDNLAEYAKKQREEYTQKALQIKERRQACAKQMQSLQEQRMTQRKQMAANCKMPTIASTMGLTAEAVKSMRDQAVQQMKSCQAQLKAFDVETKKNILSIKQACFQDERSVLGLSTTVSYNTVR